MKEIVQKYITEFLQALKSQIPCELGNHAFVLGDDGRLNLVVKINDKFQTIIFDENYTEDSAEDLAQSIYNILKEHQLIQ
jgi:hypothetical protein